MLGMRAFTGRAPTRGLLVGMIVTVAAVGADSLYVTRQMARLRALQTDLADRNRRDSLQLLRIQNDLNAIGLAMRDMLDGDAPYPLTAWSAQLQRTRQDLDDALRREEQIAVAERTPEQRRYLAGSVSQFGDAVDRMFAAARAGRDAEARAQIRLSLQARQAALDAAVAMLLVENNASEEQTAARMQGIYGQVERQVYLFLAATLAAIILTSLYLMRSNRRIFERLERLSEERRDIAQQLMATRESTLKEVARELHDEFGQTLTAMGAMLGRARKQMPEASPLRSDLHEVATVAQGLLDHVRELSQTLHPSILDEIGLEGTLDWYLSTVERQSGVAVRYERSGPVVALDVNVAIQVYRILQEALTNVARHASATQVWVRLRVEPTSLNLEVEDHGKGLDEVRTLRGLGIVTMRERAALVGGTIEFVRPRAGGTLVRLRVPVQ